MQCKIVTIRMSFIESDAASSFVSLSEKNV